MNIGQQRRSVLQQLAVTDSAATAQNLGKVIRETYTFYLSRSEVDGIIAKALAISQTSRLSGAIQVRDEGTSQR